MLLRRLLPLTVTALLLAAASAAAAPPANDTIAKAAPLGTGTFATAAFELAQAGKEAGEPLPASGAGKTVWHKWTPAQSGGVRVTACVGATFPGTLTSRIEVYTGDPANGIATLVPVTAFWFNPCSGAAEVAWQAQAGTTYWIQADAPSGTVPTPSNPTMLGALELRQRTKKPKTVFTDWPAVTGRSHLATFRNETDDPGVFFLRTCWLDGKQWNACQTPHQLSNLADGQHTLKVQATDEFGNVEAVPAVKTWWVDGKGPDVAITTPAGSTSHTSTGTLEFTAPAEPAVSFECRVGVDASSPWVPCSSPFTTQALPDGFYYVAVRGYDAFGNMGPAASRAIAIDTAHAPQPAAPTPTPTPTTSPLTAFTPVASTTPVVATSTRAAAIARAKARRLRCLRAAKRRAKGNKRVYRRLARRC